MEVRTASPTATIDVGGCSRNQASCLSSYGFIGNHSIRFRWDRDGPVQFRRPDRIGFMP